VKIVVIGASRLIGCKLVTELHEQGVTASPDTAVDTLTGEGLADALAGASVVVDVSNAPTLDDADTSTRNLLAAEAAAGVGHHIAVSVIGTQEALIAASSIPYTIVRATQLSADEVVSALAELSVGSPVNGIVEIAGPARSHC
jgi:uncharacterized protein YbjT (DUF2867 family)